MIKEPRFQSYNSKLDFERAVIGLGLKYTSESNILVNQWSYDEVLRAFRINKDNTTIGYISFELGYLEIGDTIDLAAEIMWMTGSNRGMLAIDRFDGGGIGLGSKTTWSIQAKEESGFQLTEMSFVATKEGHYRATVGLWTSMVGQLYIRNPRCLVKSIVKGSDTNVRKGTFRKATETGTIIRRTDFAGDDCTISISNSTDIVITWNRPMKGLRPVSFVSNEYFAVGNLYTPSISFSRLESVIVRFYPIGSNTPVKVSDLPNEIHFSVKCEN